MIPTNLEALERSELLSPEGKLRFASEPDVPSAAGDEDESVGSFVARRFGREVYEALVEPLMTGIYGGDGDRLSLRATFPQLRVLELEHGSILRGLSAPPPSDLPPFVSLRGGMGSLVFAVVDACERTEVLLGRGAARVSRSPEGYGLELVDGVVIEADGVVVATPAFVTAQLLADLDPELAAAHAEIPYASSVVVTLAFSRADVTPLDGYGYLVPRVDGADVLACTWTSQKWEGRAPDDSVLIRVYAGRFGGRDLTEDADDDLVALAGAEVGLVGVAAEPVLTRGHRWPRGMPQYLLGHPELLAQIDSALSEYPGLEVAGAAYRGVGIPDCIRSGELAAESVARSLAGARA
jgi:oxygen-dependent protoporphyrinogen oxidase